MSSEKVSRIESQRPAERIDAGAGARGQCLGQCQVLGLDVEQPALAAVQQQSRQLGPGERAEPALMGQSQGLGGASEELLELEVEAEIAMIHGQPPDRGLGQGPAGRGKRRKPGGCSAANVG